MIRSLRTLNNVTPGILILVCMIVTVGRAQQRPLKGMLSPHAVRSFDGNADADSAGGFRPKIVEAEDRGKSTRTAMLLSAVLPGAGQVYAERYWTIPVIWGFGIYFYSQYRRGDDLYLQYRADYAASVIADTVDHQGNGNYLAARNLYRDERDRFAIYMALTYIMNLVDAYVGAALYGFDVSDNLGGGTAIRFKLRLR